MATVTAGTHPTQRDNMITLTHVMYGLHAFSAVMGLLGPMLVVTAFLTGWPSIIAIIINYVKRDDVRRSYLESHFSWQRRTFWYALLWIVVAALMIVSVIGIPIAMLIAAGVGIWILYRIIRGWIALSNRKPVRGYHT